MGRTRKFCGKTTTLWRKCENCEKRESCMKVDKDFIAKKILIDCEGFYYVFKKLEIFEAYPILDGDVEKHNQDMAEYEERHKGVPFLTPPLVANGTLAAELALKYLVFKEKGEYECSHQLQFLFNQLTEPHKTALIERICKEAHQNETTLTENLNNISNLFEDFRYFYEHSALGYSNFWNDFVHIVCDYALSFQSECEEID